LCSLAPFKFSMSRSTLLLLAAVFCGANIALVQPIAQAKTKVEIARIAKNITLRIEAVGADTRGSGILLQKQGDVYTVLTAGHVVAKGSSFKITAFDGQIYSSISVRSAGSIAISTRMKYNVPFSWKRIYNESLLNRLKTENH
jgi:hypothetical protein